MQQAQTVSKLCKLQKYRTLYSLWRCPLYISVLVSNYTLQSNMRSDNYSFDFVRGQSDIATVTAMLQSLERNRVVLYMR